MCETLQKTQDASTMVKHIHLSHVYTEKTMEKQHSGRQQWVLCERHTKTVNLTSKALKTVHFLKQDFLVSSDHPLSLLYWTQCSYKAEQIMMLPNPQQGISHPKTKGRHSQTSGFVVACCICLAEQESVLLSEISWARCPAPAGVCQPCWMNLDSCTATDSHIVSWQRRGQREGGGIQGRRCSLSLLTWDLSRPRQPAVASRQQHLLTICTQLVRCPGCIRQATPVHSAIAGGNVLAEGRVKDTDFY